MACVQYASGAGGTIVGHAPPGVRQVGRTMRDILAFRDGESLLSLYVVGRRQGEERLAEIDEFLCAGQPE